MDIIKIKCATIRDGEACAYLTEDHGVRTKLAAMAGEVVEGELPGHAVAGFRRPTFSMSRRATGSINADAPVVKREAEEDWGR
jgi:hypothetical protein